MLHESVAAELNIQYPHVRYSRLPNVLFLSFSLSEIVYLLKKFCLIASALLSSFTSRQTLAAAVRKGLNAVNVKVVVTDNSISIGDF